MEPWKVAIMAKTFPFLRDICAEFEFPPLEKINRIKVEKGDPMLLASKGKDQDFYVNGEPWHAYTIYFAVVFDGGKWQIIELESGGSWQNSDNSQGDSWNAPAIGEQIFSKKLSPEFIIECEGNNLIEGEGYREWVIHKMNNFNLPEFYKKEIDQAAAALKAEIDRIYAT